MAGHLPSALPNAFFNYRRVFPMTYQEVRMTYQEVIQRLCFGRATLHRWIHEGKLKPLLECKGKSRRFARSAVQQLAHEHTAGLL